MIYISKSLHHHTIVKIIVVIQLLSCVQLFVTPWSAAHKVSSSFTVSQSFAQIHVHWVNDAIQLSYPLLPLSPLALNFFQHQGLFQWVTSLHQVAKVLELLNIFCYVLAVFILIVPILVWNVPMVSPIFLKRSLFFPILLFSSISLHWSLEKPFLSLLGTPWNSAFSCGYIFSFLLCLLLLFFLYYF